MLLVLLHLGTLVGIVRSLVPNEEVASLRALFEATNGPHWTYGSDVNYAGSKWNFTLPDKDIDPCADDWYDIQCNHDAITCASTNCTITRMEIINYNAQGYIPEDLSALTSLGRLSFRRNDLQGTLPRFLTSLTKLYYINFAVTHISGTIPSGFGCLPYLNLLDTSSTLITGAIPDSLGELTNFGTIQVFDSLMSGTLPSSMFEHTQLSFVNFENNFIHGTVPHFTTEMWTFSGYNNLLSGSLSPHYFNGYYLKNLYLGDNYLTGYLPELDQVYPRMDLFYVGNNLLSGSIPFSIVNYSTVVALQLSHNLFTGPIPPLMPVYGLQYIDFAYNRLTGTIPCSVAATSKLHYLYLQHNKFHGTIPTCIGSAIKLRELFIFNNQFTGTLPIELLRSQTVLSLLIQDNLFEGKLSSSMPSNESGPAPFPLLTIIDISSNRFSGTVPAELFTLPNLRHVSIIQNCFHGTIPASICEHTILEGLLLEGLRSGAKCRGDVWDPGNIANTYFTNGIRGSIPECIFAMPNLEILHITANRLTGTMPSSFYLSKLTDLKLSDNRLSGEIPSFLKENFVQSIDLSRNKFTGDFDMSPPTSNSTTTLKLNVNRLSGNMPAEFRKMDEIEVLAGNIFSCGSRKEIPNNDPDGNTYICGSDAYDVPLVAWTACAAVLIGVLSIAILIQSEKTVAVCNNHHRLLEWQKACAAKIRDAFDQLRHWYDLLSQASLGDFKELSNFVTILSSLRTLALKLALSISLVFGIIYICLKLFAQCGTHVHQYRWLVTAAYLIGILPAAVMIVGLVGLLWYLLYHVNALHGSCTALVSSLNQDSNQKLVPSDNSATYDLPVHHSTYGAAYMFIGALVVANCSIVLFVKGVYVYLLIWQDISYSLQFMLKLLLSIFDIVWNAVIVTKAVSLFPHLIRSKIRIRLHLFLLLFNSIVAPMISAACTDRNCFVEIFVGRDSVESSSTYVLCTNYAGTSCTLTSTVSLTTTFTPPFTYSYQCMSAIQNNFIPVFMFTHIILGFILPFVLLIFMKAFSTPSVLLQKVRGVIPNILFPSLYLSRESPNTKKLIRPSIILSNLLHHMTVMLTFGIAAPLLALCIAFSICVMTVAWQIIMGRYIHYLMSRETLDVQANSADPENSDTQFDKENINGHWLTKMSAYDSCRYLNELNFACRDVWQGPIKAVWVMVDYACVFFICLGVDIVGDVYGWYRSILYIVIPTIFLALALRIWFRRSQLQSALAYIADLIQKDYFRSKMDCIADGRETGVAMESITVSPLVAT